MSKQAHVTAEVTAQGTFPGLALELFGFNISGLYTVINATRDEAVQVRLQLRCVVTVVMLVQRGGCAEYAACMRPAQCVQLSKQALWL